MFRLRAVNETELLSNLGSALPDTRTNHDTAQTLVCDDLAVLFDLDMEERKAPAPSRSADTPSAGPGKKTRKRVVENLAVAAATGVKAKANAVTPAPEKNAGPNKQGHRPAAKDSTRARSAPAISKGHHGTHAVSSEKDRYRPNQIRGEASNSEALGGNPKGTSESHRVRSPPIRPCSGDRGPSASQPIFVSAGSRVIRCAQTGQ